MSSGLLLAGFLHPSELLISLDGVCVFVSVSRYQYEVSRGIACVGCSGLPVNPLFAVGLVHRLSCLLLSPDRPTAMCPNATARSRNCVASLWNLQHCRFKNETMGDMINGFKAFY